MLTAYPVTVDVVVRWGDMDSLGHVNNVMYLRYFEIARIAYLERLGMEPPGPDWGEQGLIISAVSCRFKLPVTYPDTLSVGARVSAVGEDRLIMEHVAVSRRLDKVVAVGDAEIVSYDYLAGCRASLSPGWLTALCELEGREPDRLPPRVRRNDDRT